MDDRSFHLGPGKAAPRLIHDLLDHDPLTPKKNGRHILAKAAPQFRGKALPPRTGVQDCRHSLMRKLDRTNAPVSQDQQPTTSTVYLIAAYCSGCCCHFDITIDYRSRDGRQTPCRLSDLDNPMHHLLHVASTDAKEYAERLGGHKKYDTILEAHRFECSGVACPLIVDIKICPPKLTPKLLSLITDPKKVFARGKRIIQEEPLRFNGFNPIAPYQVLENLRTYLRDARSAQQDPEKLKKIAKRNKRLLLGFADECDSLFEYLDFKVVMELGSDGSVDDANYFWQLPLITDVNKNFIDDVMIEIDLILFKLSETDQARGAKVLNIGIPVLKDLERSLGCHDYPKRNRATVDLTIEEHPYYASLGAVDSFTDEYLSWAYDRQCECDPRNKPYYLDCLTDIAKGRQSSDLETKVVMATSAGQHGLNEIEEAYKFFALDPATTEGDDYIIGVYAARIESAPRQKDEARRSLKVIASARNSEKISAIANDQSMSLHEALKFLNVAQDTPSDMIEAAAVVLALDADKSRAARALRVIATERGNDYALHRAASRMETGEGGSTLSVADAYTRLQIHSNGPSFPDETVLQYYQTLWTQAAPGSQVSFDEALRVIAEDRKSVFLFAKLDNPNADVQATRTTSEEPVGLENIGNTCYLNSLLQFYYTIQPLRDVVMNFDTYRIDPNEPDIRAGKKRVGNRVVDRAEVVKAQKFVNELHGLYENLKTASTRSVKPTKQLAKSTFITPALEANFRVYRKQSISSPDGPPPLSSIFDRPVFGPEGPPPPHRLPTPDEDTEMVDWPDKIPDNKSESSEATLIEMDAEPEKLSPYENSKGNQVFPSDVKTEQIKQDDDPFGDDTVMVNGDSNDTLSKRPAPPEKPPPVPPRNKAGLSIQTTTDTKEITESEEDGLWQFGTQQDVTEVMGNVINLLSCAVKATGLTDGGTQTDKVYDTFYGDSAVYTQKPQKLEKKIESWANLMVYPDEKGSRDIYEALDVNYDEQKVEIGNSQIPQWTSITKLPPILQIQIQRTAWNRGAGAGSKNSNPVVFPETIYLDRYMDSEDPNSPLMKRRRQAWKWKAELRKLEDRQAALQITEAEISVPDALGETKKFIDTLQENEIEGIDIDPDLPDLLEARLHEVIEELDLIKHQINIIKSKLNEQFTNMRQYEYKLQTVFIHRGEAGGGHYWIYLYDFENDIWREYNDEHVTVVHDRKRIFEHSGRVGAATPYFLAYVRSADQQDLVNAVHRDVKEVEMPDAQPSWADTMDEKLQDEGIGMDHDGSYSDVRHVEHVAPRPLLPKPAAGTETWDVDAAELDANGRPW